MASKRIEKNYQLKTRTKRTFSLPGTSFNLGFGLSDVSGFGIQPNLKLFKKKKVMNNHYLPSGYICLDLDSVSENPQFLESDLHSLYSFMRDDDQTNFLELVARKPFLLYSDEFFPLIRHMGENYSILQVAVIFNLPAFCQLILNILKHPSFISGLFPYMKDEESHEKMCHILQHYLNVGSSLSGDTALHLAAKFGFIECMKQLLVYPICIRNIKNIDGLTPFSVICEYTAGDPDLSEALEELSSDDMVLPQLLHSNESILPAIGNPTTSRQEMKKSSKVADELNTSVKLPAGFLVLQNKKKRVEPAKRGKRISGSLKKDHYKLNKIQDIPKLQGVEKESTTEEKEIECIVIDSPTEEKEIERIVIDLTTEEDEIECIVID